LLLTSYDSLVNPRLVKKLDTKGIKKYITYEVDEDTLKKKYGNHYDVVMEDLHQTDDLRVLDYDGQHVFQKLFIERVGYTHFS